MQTQEQQLSLDEMAAQMAEQMMDGSGRLSKGGGAGSMPTQRGGAFGAEGGFTPQAGGQVIDQHAKAGYADDEDEMDKGGARTGRQVTNEPGRQGQAAQTGDDVTDEPNRQMGGGAGDGGNLSQGGDGGTRKRKAGKVGISGAQQSAGGAQVSQDEDDSTRKRKAGKVGMSKADEVDEDEDEDEDGMDKGGAYSADELIKSLEVLEAVAQGSTVPATADRREELGQKLAEGTLSKSEMQELADLMQKGAGFAPDDDELSKSDQELEDQVDDNAEEFEKSYQEQFADDDELSEGYEVSPFLERHSQMTAAALDQVQGTLAKALDASQDRTQAFNSQLAKSLMGMAQLAKKQEALIKSMAERLEVVENQPLPRRGVASQAQVLRKGLPSEVGAGDPELTRSQLADVLEEMAMRGVERTDSGHRVDYSMAMLEQGGAQIAKSLVNDVIAWQRQNQGNSGSVNVR